MWSLGRGCLAVGVSAHQQVVSTILQCPDRTATTICETGGRPQSLLHRHESRSAFPPPLGNGKHQRVHPERRSPAPFRCTNGRARATRRPGFTALAVLHGAAGAAILARKGC